MNRFLRALLSALLLIGHPVLALADSFNPANPNVFTYAGNPNGHLGCYAGVIGTTPPDMAWDTTFNQLYTCITTGSASTATWIITAAQVSLVSSTSTVPISNASGTIDPSYLGNVPTWKQAIDNGTFQVAQRGTSFTGIGAAGQKVVFLTSGTSWTVPADWTNTNTIITIGAGGGGGSNAGSGGGGGAFAVRSNLTGLSGSVTYAIGAGGSGGAAGGTNTGGTGGDTYFNSGSMPAPGVTTAVGAKGGVGGGGNAGSVGTGGASGSSDGSTVYSGGAGGLGVSGGGAGGGGGAAGAQGVGGAGGSGSGSGNEGGGGGGGSGGGGSGTAGSAGGNGSSGVGGAGGNNAAGVGSGAAGSTSNGTAGTLGGGGGGSGGASTNGGAGGPGADYTATAGGTAGPGGGGGGSTYSAWTSTGAGGLYGGGGAGAGNGTSYPGGAGAQGLIVIIYTPASYSPTFTLDRWFVATNQPSANLTLSQTTNAPTGYGYSAQLQRPNGNAVSATNYLGQTVLSVDAYRWRGMPATLSFWAKAGANYSPTNSALSVQLVSGTGTNEGAAALVNGTWASKATLVSTTTTISATWTQYSFSGTFGSAISEIGVLLGFTPAGTAGANDWFEVTGVSIQPAGSAVPYNFPTYAVDLYQAQRTAVVANVWVPITTAECYNLHMIATPSVSGGGTGFSTSGTSATSLVCSQSSAAAQTLTISSDP